MQTYLVIVFELSAIFYGMFLFSVLILGGIIVMLWLFSKCVSSVARATKRSLFTYRRRDTAQFHAPQSDDPKKYRAIV